MIDLLAIKSDLISKLKRLIAELDLSEIKRLKENQYKTFIIGPISLSPQSLVGHIADQTYIHFKNRDSSFEAICLHPIEEFHRKESYNRILSLCERCPDLFIPGAQTFAPELVNSDSTWAALGEIYFFVPLLSFIRKNGETSIHVNFSKKELMANDRLNARFFDIESTLTLKSIEECHARLQDETLTPNPLKWNAMVRATLGEIEKGIVQKTVLARKKILHFDISPNPQALYKRLIELNPHSFNFILHKDDHTFLTVSPERLFSLEKGVIQVDSLAGTRPRGINPEQDEEFAQELLNSIKELSEHRYVTRFVRQSLTELSNSQSVRFNEQILKLPHVQHLHTQIQALARPQINFAQCLNILHPTPAVGGQPKKFAVALLQRLEPFNRGLYAGPAGIVSQHYSDFCVAIRSAFLSQADLHLFAGAGIVEGSMADKEWIETELKMKNFSQLYHKQPDLHESAN